MALTEQEQLIFDTLHHRPPVNGSCFVVNEPGLRLISSDASFLPALETALIEVAKHEPRLLPGGWSYVIAAFFVVGTKYAPDDLVPFLQSLPREFMKEVVARSAIGFQKVISGGVCNYNFGVAPAPELVAFVRELALGKDQAMQKIAQRALGLLTC